jgi:hypothetical protein
MAGVYFRNYNTKINLDNVVPYFSPATRSANQPASQGKTSPSQTPVKDNFTTVLQIVKCFSHLDAQLQNIS